MYKICIFGGTAEGRKLAEFLSAQPVELTVCAATEYGGALIEPGNNVKVSSGRLSGEEIEDMLRSQRFDLLIDATHPYASKVTENLCAACARTSTEYLRLLRGSGSAPESAVSVSDAKQATEYLSRTEGNILLTVGSKELPVFSALPDFENRAFARVLPMAEALRACEEAGIKPGHIIAMQGPFSEELNLALLRETGAKYLVTKDGGTAGGFREKVSAAEKAGAGLIVIGRPPQMEGLAFSELIQELHGRFGLVRKPSVTIAGIGPGNRSGMTLEVIEAIDRADCLIGAGRMLDAAHPRAGQGIFEAISPAEISEYIKNHGEYGRFTVLMSGDTGFYSGTRKLLPLLVDCDTKVLPGISSLSCLCARLGSSYEDVLSVSLHGRERNIVHDVLRNSRVFVLPGGKDGVSSLCSALTSAGLGDVKLYVGQRIGSPEEKLSAGTALELSAESFDPLSAVLVENPKADAAAAWGLPDEEFIRSSDVPMTKSEVRAVCMSKLRLTPGAVCWDVGAGTGSVSVEMALCADRGRVYAIEKNEAAVKLLDENRRKFFAENITIVEGNAPEACHKLPAPTHAFIGGSGGSVREIIALLLRKNPHVRIAATAVTLETVSELTACMREFQFDFTEAVCLSVARSRRAGEVNLMSGQNPVYIFTMRNEGAKR